MLHRVKKENDINKDKWIGIGGKFEDKESPEECLVREVRRRPAHPHRLHLPGPGDLRLRPVGHRVHAPLHRPHGEEDPTVVCDEGDLEWVDKDRCRTCPSGRGIRSSLDLLTQNVPFFSLKLEYVGDTLVRAVLSREGTSHPGMTPAQPMGKPA